MFTNLVDEISIITDSKGNEGAAPGQAELKASIAELSSLRFSILLTARFVDSPAQSLERREELRERLATLRRQYENKIDEIAMTLSVQAAMNAKDEVERAVSVPLGVSHALLGEA